MATTVDYVSDMVCPWCFIGLVRLEEALGATADAALSFHPFQLDPATPAEGYDLREHLAAKFGGDPTAMFARVEEVARSSGIPLDFRRVRRMPSTLKAHTLVAAAAAKGTQRGLVRALFQAYFLEERDLGDDATLAEIATAHGFTADEARATVSDPAALQATRREAEGLSAQGIRGVPFVIFGGKLAVSGAQPVEAFREAFTRAQG